VSYNYAQFVAQLANFLVIPPTDANYQTALPQIIDDSEQRLYRELDLLSTVVRDTSANLTANSRSFTLPQALGRFVVTNGMNFFTPSGTTTNRNQLVPVTRDYLDAVWGNEAAASTPSLPEYYAPVSDQQFIVGPAPDAAYTMEVIGTIRPTPLSASNVTTVLSLYLPDLFFAEACIAGYAYMKDFGAMTDDPQGSESWAKHYSDLWQSANVEEMRKRYASQAWTSLQPAPIATPPRV
jgi:hypothetical protein